MMRSGHRGDYLVQITCRACACIAWARNTAFASRRITTQIVLGDNSCHFLLRTLECCLKCLNELHAEAVSEAGSG